MNPIIMLKLPSKHFATERRTSLWILPGLQGWDDSFTNAVCMRQSPRVRVLCLVQERQGLALQSKTFKKHSLELDGKNQLSQTG